MVIKSRTLISVSVAVLMAAVSLVVQGQNYPIKPVRIIVPFAAGGPADIYARMTGLRLQESLGQSFVIENRPGAGSIIGTEVAAKAPADGYTLLMMSNTHTINESLIAKKPYALMKDFVPIAPINYSDLLLVVHPSVPAKNVAQLIQLMKAKPHAFNYASSGNGTPYHLAAEYFKSMSGVDIVHVPHKGSSEARTSVMSGQVELMFDAITTMTPLAQSGRVRALASTGLVRSLVLPQVPTISESGVKGYEATIWLGLMAPVHTPQAVLERLNSEMMQLTGRSDIKKTWNEQGAQPMSMGLAAFEQYLNQDIAKWAKVVKASGAHVDP
jgi:hypothetical protein